MIFVCHAAISMSYMGETEHPEKVLGDLGKAFRRLCFPFMIVHPEGKSVCEDSDGKITYILCTKLGSISLKRCFTMLQFCVYVY